MPHAILFIDEIHTVIGAGATSGGAMDASNLLKPALSGGTIRCIGSTTYKEFRNHFEKDRALLRRFQKIDVNEPSVEDTIKILKGLRTASRITTRSSTRPTRSRPRWSCRRATSTTASCPTRRST
jgi:ATP-dependent Clp protease ATP-binding subunit ClpA